MREFTDTKKRINWLDMAKGYGILLIMINHIFSTSKTNWVSNTVSWIYTFHVPLFFILSGYVFNYKDDFKTFFTKKVKSLIVPYICFGIPMLVFHCIIHIINNDRTMDQLKEIIINFFVQNRLWTLWYLAVIFVLNIIFYLAYKLLKKDSLMLIFSIALTIGGFIYIRKGGTTLPWNIDAAMTMSLFFYIGYMYKTHSGKIDKILDNKKSSILIFPIALIINLSVGYFNFKNIGEHVSVFYIKYGNEFLFYISALSGSLCLIIISKFLTLKSIRYIGRNTYTYFLWHQTIMMPAISSIMLWIGLNKLDDTTFRITETAIITLILTIIALIIERTPLRVMNGKFPKKEHK